MRRLIQGLFMIVCALVGLGMAFQIVTVDALLYLGLMFADNPDPHRPGHLKGVIVSGPELLAKTLVTVVSLAAAVWLWRCLRKSDASP